MILVFALLGAITSFVGGLFSVRHIAIRKYKNAVYVINIVICILIVGSLLRDLLISSSFASSDITYFVSIIIGVLIGVVCVLLTRFIKHFPDKEHSIYAYFSIISCLQGMLLAVCLYNTYYWLYLLAGLGLLCLRYIQGNLVMCNESEEPLLNSKLISYLYFDAEIFIIGSLLGLGLYSCVSMKILAISLSIGSTLWFLFRNKLNDRESLCY